MARNLNESLMRELKVIFRTQSEIEAQIVRALLETHGIKGFVSSDVSHSLSPLEGFNVARLSVRAQDASRAGEVIGEYRDETLAQVERIRGAFGVLESRLQYTFTDRRLLEHALTHRSRSHEDSSGVVVDNESLEFLGDAVLGLVVSDRLFRDFPDYDEGRKSKAKAQLVSAPTLARLGNELKLGDYLLLGRGEEKTGGRRKASLIADSFEAVVAAIYLDGGFTVAAAFIEREFRGAIEQMREAGVAPVGTDDHKSALQEWLQGQGRPLPNYRLARTEGPDHKKIFLVEVLVGNDVVAPGDGRSKKEAEQSAARRALAVLTSEGCGEKAVLNGFRN